MTPSDWALLMKVGQRKKYSKGSVIVAEGEKTSSLFQITRGQCSVQKDGKTLAVLGETELLGEIGFLEGHPASATVVADSDRVDVYSLEDSQLKIAWVADPALSAPPFAFSHPSQGGSFLPLLGLDSCSSPQAA